MRKTLAVLFVAALVLGSACIADPTLRAAARNRLFPQTKQEDRPLQRLALEKILQLYRTRVESAEIEKKSDLIKLEFAHTKWERLQRLLNNASVSERDVMEAKREYDMDLVEVEADDNMIREARLQLELMEIGVNAGAVNLDDLRIPTELLRRR